MKVKNKQLYPKGKLVSVGQNKMHIYTEGINTEKPTLVFMAGATTVAPVYDFKPLYSLLSDEFRIVVVEKFGYGYSDICDISRNIDTMVDEIRTALNAHQIVAPYILMPHSMSGLEAIRWKQTYPNEVAAIIGLDMATPVTYKNFNIKKIQKLIPLLKLIVKLRIHKIPKLYPLSTLSLNDEEKQQQILLMHRNALNINYIREGEALLENAKIIDTNDTIQCPILLFCSNGKQIDKDWISNQEQFAETVHAKLIKFDCGHYVHYYKSEEIVKRVIEFVNALH